MIFFSSTSFGTAITISVAMSRRDHVHGDAFGGILLRQRLGKTDIACFRRGIIRLTHLAFLSVDRRDVDNPTETALAHPLDHRPAHIEQ